jgi:hypothetical protein
MLHLIGCNLELLYLSFLTLKFRNLKILTPVRLCLHLGKVNIPKRGRRTFISPSLHIDIDEANPTL